MQTLPSSDVEPVPAFRSTENVSDPSLKPRILRQLGDRLRATYDVAEQPVSARLIELVERLSQRLRTREGSPASLDAE